MAGEDDFKRKEFIAELHHENKLFVHNTNTYESPQKSVYKTICLLSHNWIVLTTLDVLSVL